MKRKKASFSFVLFLRDTSLRLALFFSAADNVDVARQSPALSTPLFFYCSSQSSHSHTPPFNHNLFGIFYFIFFLVDS